MCALCCQGGGKASGKDEAKGFGQWHSGGKSSSGKSAGKSGDGKGKRPHELTAEQQEAKRAKCVCHFFWCLTRGVS